MKHVKIRWAFSIAMVMVLIALTACGSSSKSSQGSSDTAAPVSNAPSGTNSPTADSKSTGAKPKIGVSEISFE
jgi:ABC-type oligopeptide transport system substrate-binding subunit